jgi:hypothetical protein
VDLAVLEISSEVTLARSENLFLIVLRREALGALVDQEAANFAVELRPDDRDVRDASRW